MEIIKNFLVYVIAFALAMFALSSLNFEKLIKKIESLSGVYNDKALSESKTLKLYNPWLMTIITMPLAYILRVLKILVCLIVLLYFFKIVDFFFDANIVKEATIYISKINNLDFCKNFIFFSECDKVL